MCFCPICKEHCTNGVVKGQSECEFWNPQENDCRIRKCLELWQKSMEAQS